jgi:hypothetical protein
MSQPYPTPPTVSTFSFIAASNDNSCRRFLHRTLIPINQYCLVFCVSRTTVTTADTCIIVHMSRLPECCSSLALDFAEEDKGPDGPPVPDDCKAGICQSSRFPAAVNPSSRFSSCSRHEYYWPFPFTLNPNGRSNIKDSCRHPGSN